ncbi:hypothetical protein [Croceicoccus hydrothermalis]|uniref:hypothetical protein n=1 Tax=Croceicoccus hydrothermalis TaxID=2867964 RepID=UPI001EFA662B|nr:hypothetical protein [Croceicoccus hydrothermalis]
MLIAMMAGLLITSANSVNIPCPEVDPARDYHLKDVCGELSEQTPAYSATFRGSLIPAPASQQVMVYRTDGVWMMRIAGYRWERGGEVVTRRREVAVSDADAEDLVGRLTETDLRRLAQLPYYGSKDVICLDGASLELAIGMAGRKSKAAQHSCAGKTELHQLAAAFRQLALKYDLEFEGLLAGLRN